MKFFYLVWSNLKRKKLRTSLTLLSILVAFVLFSLLSALKLALTGGVLMADANRLIVRHRVSFIQPLPYAYMARMAHPRRLRIHTTWFGGIYQIQEPIWHFPVEPEPFRR